MSKVETIKSSLKFLVQKHIEQGSHGFSDNNDNEVSWKEVLEWIEQQSSEDCISREAAIDVVKKWFDLIGLNSDICIDGLISLPPATRQQKIGKWIRNWCEWQQYLECSKCGYETGLRCDTNYCPNCGAKMESEDKYEIDN